MLLATAGIRFAGCWLPRFRRQAIPGFFFLPSRQTRHDLLCHNKSGSQSRNVIDGGIFVTYYVGMTKPRMGRPPKPPEERREQGMRIPLTDAEKALIEQCAEADGVKPITWAREALLRVAAKKSR
jgi:hypothetical protein